MILSINVEKQNIVFVLLYLTKYNTFIMKTLDRLGIRRNIPPHNKGHILKKEKKKKKQQLTLYSLGTELNVFSLRSGTRQRCLLPLLIFTVRMEALARAIKQDKELKDIQIEKV